MEKSPSDRPSMMARKAVSEVIALQRRIFARQRKAIESQVAHGTKGFARYRNEYRRAVGGYMHETGFGALSDHIARSRIAFVADYHTCKRAQRTLVKLLRSVMQQADNICLAMEFIPIQRQADLDLFLEGKITEQTFLRRIRYREQWPYDIWPNFKPIFELAQENGIPIVAIDSDSMLPLPTRDKLAAVEITRAAQRYPNATLFVFAGQMHISPTHLPQKVDMEFVRRGMSVPERVIVYQNAEEIYWQLAQSGNEDVEVVKVGPGEYCVNNTPPLVQQLSYLHWVHFDEELIEYSELENTVRSLIVDLSKYLNLDAREARDAANRVRVLMPGDLNLLETLESAGMEANARKLIVRQAHAEESVCIPHLGIIYLATLSVNHAAEEAAHYLKFVTSGGTPPDHLRDLFYFTTLNEACAFFASKVINPKRKTDHEGRLRAAVARARKTGELGIDELAAQFVLDHLAWERGPRNKSQSLASASNLAAQMVFNAAAHMLGYILGDKLFYGLTDGLVPKKTIQQLFADPLDAPKVALKKYLELSALVTAVKIPRRI